MVLFKVLNVVAHRYVVGYEIAELIMLRVDARVCECVSATAGM